MPSLLAAADLDLCHNCALPFDDLLAKIQASVQEFSGATQADDITLILARCR
jgi:hypothetical protein